MADTSDVEAAIVSLLSPVFYPNGTGAPSVLGAAVNIERGWPTEADIRSATSAGMTLVRVHALTGLSRDVTRFERDYIDQPQSAPTLTATLSGFQVTFGGTPAAGQFVGVISNGTGYAYAVQASDTLTSIAAALAASISGASSSGAVLTLPSGGPVPVARVDQSGNSVVEAGRIQQVFNVVTWAPTPALRDTAMSYQLGALSYNYRMTLGDTASSIATLMDVQASGPDDIPSRANEWRRDIRLTIDFPVSYVLVAPPVTITELEVQIEANGTVVDTVTEYA